MKTMLAAVFEGEGSLVLKQVPVPQLEKDDQVILKVDAVSICGTDVHITAVPPGYVATKNTILGHELVGTVVEKGSKVQHVEIGDCVVINPNNYCGNCVFCRKNLPNLCMHIEPLGIDYNGAFAEYCLVNSKVVYKIKSDVPAEVAACAEPIACAINGMNKANIKPGDSIVVIGAGPIGLMLTMLAKKSGADKIFLLETAQYRIDFAKKMNIATVINPMQEDVSEIIKKQTEIGVDFIFDVTGSQIVSSIDLIRKGGTIVLFGVNMKAAPTIKQNMITTKEISVLGTWLANATFPEAVKLLEIGSINFNSLITDILPLNRIHEGIKKLAEGKAIKIIIKP